MRWKSKIIFVLIAFLITAGSVSAVTGDLNYWFFDSSKDLLRLVQDLNNQTQVLIRVDDQKATTSLALLEVVASTTPAVYINPDLTVEEVGTFGFIKTADGTLAGNQLVDIYGNLPVLNSITNDASQIFEASARIGANFQNSATANKSATALFIDPSTDAGAGDYYFVDGIIIDTIVKDGAGTITSIAAIYTEPQDAATYNYSLATNKGYIYHGDNVKINPSAVFFEPSDIPTVALDVVGDSKIDGGSTTTGTLYADGYASTTGGLFTVGDGHIGNDLTVDGIGTFGQTYMAILGDDATQQAGDFYDGTTQASFADGTNAGVFYDGTNTIIIGDGTYAINATGGSYFDGNVTTTKNIHVGEKVYMNDFISGLYNPSLLGLFNSTGIWDVFTLFDDTGQNLTSSLEFDIVTRGGSLNLDVNGTDIWYTTVSGDTWRAGNATTTGDHYANNLKIATTTSATSGVIYMEETPYIHSYGLLNTFVGKSAGNFTLTGNKNVGIGDESLMSLTSGSNNMALGYNTLSMNLSGVGNVAVGASSLAVNTASRNTAIGQATGFLNTTGQRNVFIGRSSGYVCGGVVATNANTTGDYNTYIGYHTGASVASASSLQYSSAIGSQATVGCSNCMALGGVMGSGYQTNVGISTSTPSASLSIANGGQVIIGEADDRVNQVVCFMASGKLGYCSDAPNASGQCSCTSL